MGCCPYRRCTALWRGKNPVAVWSTALLPGDILVLRKFFLPQKIIVHSLRHNLRFNLFNFDKIILLVMPDKAKKAKAAKPAANGRKKKANGYDFPDPLPEGEVLVDAMKKEWILGTSIGKGGFGEIYCASDYKDGKYDKSYPFVIKIEPHENGPLFVEQNFYIRAAKQEFINEWKSKEKKSLLGVPSYISSGTHKNKEKNYRFLVMERFGKDLWSLFLQNERKFPVETVYKCAVQIIDALEYIHSKGFVHGDIKGANLVLGLKKNTENTVFLVDFGLVTRFVTGEFKKDPKQAHNGTAEYTSCDNHQGVPTRRGDLEILGYNLLQWISSTLPWENSLKKVEEVFKKKQQLMDDVKEYFKNNLPDIPECLVNYFVYIAKLKHNESPDYNLCRKFFETELKKLKSDIKKLDFEGTLIKKAESTKKQVQKRARTVIKDDIKKPKPKSNPRMKKKIDETSDKSDNDMESDDVEVKPEVNKRSRKLNPRLKKKIVETDETSDKSDNDMETDDVDQVKPEVKKGSRKLNPRLKKKIVETDETSDKSDNDMETDDVDQVKPEVKKGSRKLNPRLKKKIVETDETSDKSENDMETDDVEVKPEENKRSRNEIVQTVSDSDDDFEEPKQKVDKSMPKRKGQKQKVVEDEDEIIPATPEEKPEVQKKAVNGRARKPKSDEPTENVKSNGMQMRKRKIVEPLADDSEDEIIPETPEEKPKPKKGIKKAVKPKKVVEVKRNWRDCPTMRGGN